MTELRSVLSPVHRLLCICAALLFIGAPAALCQRPWPEYVPLADEACRPPDPTRQQELSASDVWLAFVAAHPSWVAEFNEATGLPKRAYGPAIPVGGAGPTEQAWAFVQSELARFGVPTDELVHSSTIPGQKVSFVHFTQQHQGMPVLRSRLRVKLDPLRGVIGFAMDMHEVVGVPQQHSWTETQASEAAVAGLAGVTSTIHQGYSILPIHSDKSVVFRQVHEVLVHTQRSATPGRYRTLVDAENGKLWYRANEIMDHEHSPAERRQKAQDDDDQTQVQVVATVFPNGPLEPAQLVGMPNMRVIVDGSNFLTAPDGSLDLVDPGPLSAVAQLRGRWSIVTTNAVMASLSGTLETGANTLDLTPASTARERSAYYSVDRIHGHSKAILPDFTGMDFPIPTKVDISGNSCNGFYDGTSINFFASGNGCRPYANLHDVVYHEYGHGINDKFYQGFNASFINGAMNEGYADLWAMSLTGQPTIGKGYQSALNELSIRRYDQEPRVYPQDLVAQIHADGQIIAGAWWSTYELLGDMDLMLELFAATLPGLQAMAFGGEEGTAFRDVLIDALQADDDDGNITNGTPNGNAIVQGFARHGITLLSGISLQHAPVFSAAANAATPVGLSANISFPANSYIAAVKLFYRTAASDPWQAIDMASVAWGEYTGTIPPQAAGTLVSYYFGMEDLYGQLGAVLPVAAAAVPDANVPFFTLIGMELQATSDGDLLNELGPFTAGLPGDNATAGQWQLAVPVPSFSGTNGTGFPVQPGTQITAGGAQCWITGNAVGPNDAMGAADVDGGVTTLLSTTIDLSDLVDPVVVYHRWYMNGPPGGSNPSDDWWQVQVSDDDGVTWVSVEATQLSQRSWRRMAFRVLDHVPANSLFRMRFMASDSLRPGQNANGGSIVEAAVDEVQIWEAAGISTGIDQVYGAIEFTIHPVPATDVIYVRTGAGLPASTQVEVLDMAGRTLLLSTPRPEANGFQLDISALAAGHYVLRVNSAARRNVMRFSIAR